MPTPITVPGRTVQIGLSKQSAQGTAISPTSSVGYWLRWLQGSKVRPDADWKQEWEGDGGRGQSLNYKTRQNGLGKMICYPRPQEIALLMQAFCGSGSDAFSTTGAFVGSWVSGGTPGTPGAQTSVAITAGAGTILNGDNITINPGLSDQETVAITSLSGTNPNYTAGFTTVKAHSGTPNITKPYTHVFTPQNVGTFSYYTLGQNTGTASGNRMYQQVWDAVLTKMVITASKDSVPLKVDCDWLGRVNSQVTALQTTSFVVDKPFYWFSVALSVGANLLASSGQQWASALTDITITLDNNVNIEDYIIESITPAVIAAGNLTAMVDMTFKWQDGGLFAAAFMNNVLNGTNGTSGDSANVPVDDFNVTFSSSTDSLQTFKIDMPNASLKLADIEPDISGKPIDQKASLVALTPAPIFTATCLNNVNAAF